MRRWLTVPLAGVFLVAWTPGARAEALVDDFGRWDLNDLRAGELGLVPGLHDLEVTPGFRRPTQSVPFRLPRGARQGRNAWYLIRLHALVELAPDTGSGIAYVGGATNDRAASLFMLRVRAFPGRPPRVRWSTVDEVRGTTVRVVRRSRVEIRQTNFVQNRGVRPGANALSFNLEQLGNVKVQRVRVLADSGLEVSRRSPAHLRLAAVLPRGRVRVGELFTVGYKLANTGDRVAYGTAVGLTASSRALRIRRPRVRRFGRLRRQRSGAFRIRARRPGRYRLILSAGSTNVNDPEIEIAVPISP